MVSAEVINSSSVIESSKFALGSLPAEVFDRAGLPVDTSGDRWIFNSADFRTISWSKLERFPESILYSLKFYAISRLERVSPVEAYNFCMDATSVFASIPLDHLCKVDSYELAPALFQYLVEVIQYLRNANRIYQFYRIREWYNWCVDMLPDHPAFSEEYAAELNLVYVPGNTKGEAVRVEDLEAGPLYDSEVEGLRKALLQDSSMNHRHIMQRAAIAIFLAFGRNPLNVMLLREEDILKVTDGAGNSGPEFLLRIPRIKKRTQTYRQDFRECYLDSETLKFLSELVDANRTIETCGLPRPIFMRTEADPRRIGTPMEEYAFHIDPPTFSSLLNEFIVRKNVVSCRTMKQLYLTPRRLRYTFATRMVAQGASAQSLAKMLDHSDTQSVRVYFELGNKIVEHLDKAAAQRIGAIVGSFKGCLITSDNDAINGGNPSRQMSFSLKEGSMMNTINIGVCGKEDLCRLDPPYSCYLCSKFQPYIGAEHSNVLDDLIARRVRMLQTNDKRIAVQLDDIIYAVGQVMKLIEDTKAQEVLHGQ